GECGAAADPYVECDPLLVLLDVLLLKPQAHRHVVHNLVLASPTPHARPLCLATALILLCHATLLVFRAAHGITVDPADLLSLPIIAQGVAVSLLSKLLFLALVFFSLPAARHLLSWLPAIGPPHAGSSEKKPQSVPFPVVFYSLLLSSPPECLALPLLVRSLPLALPLSHPHTPYVQSPRSQTLSSPRSLLCDGCRPCIAIVLPCAYRRCKRRLDIAVFPRAAQMAGRVGRDKGALRAMMREMAQKTEKRIESPLVRCGTGHRGVVRDGVGWWLMRSGGERRVKAGVLTGGGEVRRTSGAKRKESHGSTERLKQRAKAAAPPPATAAATAGAPAAGGRRPAAAAAAAGALPSDFFDSASAAKRSRHHADSTSATPAMPANPPASSPAAAAEAAVRQSSRPPAFTPAAPATSAAPAAHATAPASAASAAPPNSTGLPADFFDAPTPAAATPAAPSAPAAAAPSAASAPAAPSAASAPAAPSALPSDFFDGPSTAATAAPPSAAPAAAAKPGKAGGGAGKGTAGKDAGGAGQGVLPEGFFDSKEADHKARGVEYKKPDAE
ncbi:unnamed protein product, partial [Closterium sp. Naga37s-1]